MAMPHGIHKKFLSRRALIHHNIWRLAFKCEVQGACIFWLTIPAACDIFNWGIVRYLQVNDTFEDLQVILNYLKQLLTSFSQGVHWFSSQITSWVEKIQSTLLLWQRNSSMRSCDFDTWDVLLYRGPLFQSLGLNALNLESQLDHLQSKNIVGIYT